MKANGGDPVAGFVLPKTNSEIGGRMNEPGGKGREAERKFEERRKRKRKREWERENKGRERGRLLAYIRLAKTMTKFAEVLFLSKILFNKTLCDDAYSRPRDF